MNPHKTCLEVVYVHVKSSSRAIGDSAGKFRIAFADNAVLRILQRQSVIVQFTRYQCQFAMKAS